MNRPFIHSDFPFSAAQPFELTSPVEPRYNCIAYAFGDLTKRYWPKPGFYWPQHIRRKEDVQSFFELFALQGYEGDERDTVEPGYTKIALFCDGIQPTHAAKQLPTGFWTSKLGQNVDVRHTLNSMEGGLYGNVFRILKTETRILPPLILPAFRSS